MTQDDMKFLVCPSEMAEMSPGQHRVGDKIDNGRGPFVIDGRQGKSSHLHCGIPVDSCIRPRLHISIYSFSSCLPDPPSPASFCLPFLQTLDRPSS